MTGWDRWKVSVVTELTVAKREGLTFARAWTRTMKRCPPRQMEQGPLRPSLDDEISVPEFFRTACSDAWHGRRAELEDLPDALAGGLFRDWPKVGGERLLR